MDPVSLKLLKILWHELHVVCSAGPGWWYLWWQGKYFTLLFALCTWPFLGMVFIRGKDLFSLNLGFVFKTKKQRWTIQLCWKISPQMICFFKHISEILVKILSHSPYLRLDCFKKLTYFSCCYFYLLCGTDAEFSASYWYQYNILSNFLCFS